MKFKFGLYITTLAIISILMSGCVKNSQYTKTLPETEEPKNLTYQATLLSREKAGIIGEKHIDFSAKARKERRLKVNVENTTETKIYVVVFSYIKRHTRGDRWRWDKSNIYQLNPNESTVIKIDPIVNKINRNGIYGCIGVFDKKKDAIDSTYELLDESKRLDLDLLYLLKNKRIRIYIEKYGFKRDTIQKDIITDKEITEPYLKKHELDFYIRNRIGETIYVVGFIYHKKVDGDTWRYDKTKVYKLKRSETTKIDLDTLKNKYNRVFARGFLGVFDKSQKDFAHKCTYETLPAKNKISIGNMSTLRERVVVIQVEKYGILGKIFEFALVDKKKKSHGK